MGGRSWLLPVRGPQPTKRRWMPSTCASKGSSHNRRQRPRNTNLHLLHTYSSAAGTTATPLPRYTLHNMHTGTPIHTHHATCILYIYLKKRKCLDLTKTDLHALHVGKSCRLCYRSLYVGVVVKRILMATRTSVSLSDPPAF